jgi:hypothetical protein
MSERTQHAVDVQRNIVRTMLINAKECQAELCLWGTHALTVKQLVEETKKPSHVLPNSAILLSHLTRTVGEE